MLGFIGWLLALVALHENNAPHWLGGMVFVIGLVLFWRKLAWCLGISALLHWLLSRRS